MRTIRNTEFVMCTSMEQMRLLAGVIAHVSRYLETGCPRAAQRAGLLLRHLDAGAMDQDVGGHRTIVRPRSTRPGATRGRSSREPQHAGQPTSVSTMGAAGVDIVLRCMHFRERLGATG